MSRVSSVPPTQQQQHTPQNAQQCSTVKVPHDKISMRAYEKWCQQGRPQGCQVQNWLEAERELQNEMMRSQGQRR